MALTEGQGSLKREKFAKKGYPTWEELRAIDVKRKVVLGYARDLSPMDTILNLRLIPRTVFPRLVRHVLLWAKCIARWPAGWKAAFGRPAGGTRAYHAVKVCRCAY